MMFDFNIDLTHIILFLVGVLIRRLEKRYMEDKHRNEIESTRFRRGGDK